MGTREIQNAQGASTLGFHSERTMNEIDRLKSLDCDDASIAQDIDVTSSVLRTIRTRQRMDDDAFLLPAIFATLAGAVSVIVMLQLNLTDPFTGLLDAFNLVLQ
jgi:hypothetical protein